MDAFDFEQLAKDIVTSRLKEAGEAPAACAEVARKMIVSGVTSTGAKQDPRRTVIGVCQGVMGGALLLEKDLAAIAIALLSEVAAMADELHLDPSEMMTWAMEGIARVCHVSGALAESSVQDAIEAKFMGAGEAFSALCREAGA
ncbi:MAG: hypothetical protein SF051_12775 [Elusimicrobiota bacterium]|nr:hypothetical protein [Elusimicrobiota bacterium]